MQSLRCRTPACAQPRATVVAHARSPAAQFADVSKAVVASMMVAAPAMAADGLGEQGLAAAAVVGVIGLASVLVATDPQQRRSEMASQAGGNEMDSVKNYFNSEGFSRWNKIYGETDDVNKVQLDIRTGHAQTVEKVLSWVDADGGVKDTTVCDCGCGTGLLAIPLALKGADVSASDISAAMVGETERRYNAVIAEGATAPKSAPKFEAMDLESASGSYDLVTCLDVMIHYPQEKADAMITHLASLSKDKVILSFAPYTPQYAVLKRIGELFPGPSKATRAYLHKETDVIAALEAAGFKITNKEMTATNFYFSRLLEAKRA